jgi:AraC family transcriptional regulator of adaptative response/methylated-DNA-[protein]-cysteine methyltransferase
VVTWQASPLGPLLLAARPDGLCQLEFCDQPDLLGDTHRLGEHFGCEVEPGENEHTEQARDELAGYFAGARTAFGVRLAYPGSPFQRAVWEQLMRIPYGETRAYEDVARAVGQPGAARAVGRANGLNRLAILIPCHRVINKGGRLGGYGGGLWRKEFLLDLERARFAWE